MLLLAADTSGRFGSLALLRCEPDGSCETIEVVPLAGGTFSAQMVPEIAALLERYKFSKNQIDGFAIASGPGSFTGLRVGLAAVKGLAEVLQKPIAAVSLLEVVAVAGADQGEIFSALDAGRNEVYAGEYEVSAGNTRKIGEQLLSRAEFAELVRGRVVVTPDDVIAEAARANAVEVRVIERPKSDCLGQIGWKKILAGDTVSVEVLDANYIRRSDAEIFSARKK